MLDELDHGKIADDLELETLDFKPWLPSVKENQAIAVEMAICFANSNGGLVVFGVRDRTRGRKAAVTGCSGYDLDQWRRAIYDSTRPHLTAEIKEFEIPEGMLLFVRTAKGPKPPYGTTAGVFKECRELLGLGNSRSAIVKASNLLKSSDLLQRYGNSKQKTRYRVI